MIPKDFYYFVISGLLLMLIPIGIIAWFQAGFFLKWLRVRGSRGAKTLVKIRGPLRDWWEVGKITENFLVYGKKGHRRRVVAPDGVVYRCFGVTVVDLDERTHGVGKTDYQGVNGFDAEKFEDLYTRALYRPVLDVKTFDRVLVILLIVAICAIAVCGFLIYGVSQQITALGPATVNAVV